MEQNPPAKHETRVQSLGQEDPLEKETATHSRVLAWKLQGHRSLVGCSPRGTKSQTRLVTEKQKIEKEGCITVIYIYVYTYIYSFEYDNNPLVYFK